MYVQMKLKLCCVMLSYLLKFVAKTKKNKIQFVHVFSLSFGFGLGVFVKALIGFKAFYTETKF